MSGQEGGEFQRDIAKEDGKGPQPSKRKRSPGEEGLAEVERRRHAHQLEQQEAHRRRLDREFSIFTDPYILGQDQRGGDDTLSSTATPVRQSSGHEASPGDRSSRNLEQTVASSSSRDATRHHERIIKAEEHAKMVKIAEARKKWQDFIDKKDAAFISKADDVYDSRAKLELNGLDAFRMFTPFQQKHGTRVASDTYDAFQSRDNYFSYIQKIGNKARAGAELDKYDIRQESTQQKSAQDRPSGLSS